MNSLLLGDPSPSLRWRAAVELDGAPADDEEVRAWRAEVDHDETIRTLVARLGAVGDNPQAAGYLLCQLAYLGYEGTELAGAVERIFDHQEPDGCWPTWPEEDKPAPKRRRGTPPPRLLARRATASSRCRHCCRCAAWPPPDLPPTRGPSAPTSGCSANGSTTVRGPARTKPTSASMAALRAKTPSTASSLAVTGVDRRRPARLPASRLHPERRRSDAARIGVDHLLARETRDAATLGWEVSRLVGHERAGGRFTFYVTFDHAFLLDLAARCGVSPDDRRVSDLVAYLETLRGPYGLWQHPSHPQLSRWLTFDLECSLARLADGDWIGNEEPATYTPYKKGRRRH